ncbi:chromate transporter [Oxalobacteraceae bacterium OM1]|nr:chromate transporter [Oxalobacteraceae bacterium OM1]
MPRPLTEIAIYFATLSLMAIGGANVLIPDMHRQLVEVSGWMSSKEFATLVALSQAAPGPNVLIVSLLGWKVAGIPGGLVATAAMCLPTTLLTYGFTRVWDRYREARWRTAVQAGLASVTVGLILASGYVLTRAADHNWGGYALTAGTVFIMLRTRIHPFWMLGVAAVLGIFGLV